jgi:hypothetical protein
MQIEEEYITQVLFWQLGATYFTDSGPTSGAVFKTSKCIAASASYFCSSSWLKDRLHFTAAPGEVALSAGRPLILFCRFRIETAHQWPVPPVSQRRSKSMRKYLQSKLCFAVISCWR